MEDYSQAILLNNYPSAYLNRGNIRSDLGDKQGAIDDYQKAAKFFFDKGDVANYECSLKNLRLLQR